MNDYSPDRWVLIKIKGKDETHYKVFGSWAGGYLDSDRWRLNSGVRQVIHRDGSDTYGMCGHSGSVYHCHKDAYGIAGAYNRAQLDNMLTRSPHAEVVDEEELPEIINTLREGYIDRKYD